jgi:predicted enzyme related to lactoylglutathione lyase
MARVLGIGGVFLKSNDPEQLYSWYEQHLGLPRQPGQPAVFPWRHADEPARQEITVWCLFPRDTDYFGSGGQAAMVNYIVDDLDGMLAALRTAGATVDDRREDSEYGRFGWVTDPEGNRIELWEPPHEPPAVPS